MNGVTSFQLKEGQAVPHPPAPLGLAQIERLARLNVVLVYIAGTGRVRRAKVPAVRVAQLIREQSAPILPMHNILARGCLNRSKVFHVAR